MDVDQQWHHRRRYAVLRFRRARQYQHGLRRGRQSQHFEPHGVQQHERRHKLAKRVQTAGNANVQTGWAGAGGDRDWSYGELALGFTVDPADSTRLIISDEGFAYSSTDSGADRHARTSCPPI